MGTGPDKAGERILILGGTAEASALARLLAGHEERFDVTLSLAGRTTAPKPEPVRTRIGGFGGAQGLARWLVDHAIARVVDATHPFAARISANAARACAATGTALLAIRRPPWQPVAGDRWIEVETVPLAVAALGEAPRRVFLTIGRQELAAFASAPQHAYHVRSIEPVGTLLRVPRLTSIAARGPFSREAEAALLREAAIEVLVTKNSGGEATYGKIAAARERGLPVVVIRQPAKPEVLSVATAKEAVARLLGQ